MIRLHPGRAVVAALYLALMLAATLSSGNMIARLGLRSGWLDLGHVPLFAGLCLVLLWTVQAPLALRLWAVTAFCVIFAGFDEWAQRFVPDRVPDIRDFAANVAGIGIGLILGFALIRGAAGAPVTRRGDSTR